MPTHSGQPDGAKIAANLRRAIELTELGLRLRSSVLQQNELQGWFRTARPFSPAQPLARLDAPLPLTSTAKQNLFDPEPLQILLATG